MAGSREAALKAWATMRANGTIPKRKQAEKPAEPVKKEKKSKKKAEAKEQTT